MNNTNEPWCQNETVSGTLSLVASVLTIVACAAQLVQILLRNRVDE